MAKANTTWKVLPHDPLAKLSEDLWYVRGSLEGMPLKRNMVIARRADGRLVIHNAICVDDATMAAIEGWGEVGYIVVPNGFHRLDAVVFRRRFPAAKVLCPRGARKKVEEVVTVDGTYEDFPADPTISFENLDGLGEQEGAMLVRSRDGVTIVVTDAIFDVPDQPGLTGFILRHVTASTGGPRVSRILKLFVLKDKAAFRAHLERLAATPGLRRLIVAHNGLVEGDAAAAIRAAAATI